MQSHIRILAILHLIFGVLGLIFALFLLVLFGGLTGLIGLNAPGDEALVAVPLIGGIGVMVVGFVALLSVPGVIAGVGLLSYRPWARTLTLILSAMMLLHVPFGTILGFYGFWVLLSKESAAIFSPPTVIRHPGM